MEALTETYPQDLAPAAPTAHVVPDVPESDLSQVLRQMTPAELERVRKEWPWLFNGLMPAAQVITGTAWSCSLDQLALALAAAQGEMEVADEDEYNGHLNSGYASFKSCVVASRPALAKHQLCVVQLPRLVNNKLFMLSRLIHGGSGQWIQCELDGAPSGSEKLNIFQRMGATISYLQRFTYKSLVGVATGEEDKSQGDGQPAKDAGNHPAAARKKAAQQAPPVDNRQSTNQAPAQQPAPAKPNPDKELKEQLWLSIQQVDGVTGPDGKLNKDATLDAASTRLGNWKLPIDLSALSGADLKKARNNYTRVAAAIASVWTKSKDLGESEAQTTERLAKLEQDWKMHLLTDGKMVLRELPVETLEKISNHYDSLALANVTAQPPNGLF